MFLRIYVAASLALSLTQQSQAEPLTQQPQLSQLEKEILSQQKKASQLARDQVELNQKMDHIRAELVNIATLIQEYEVRSTEIEKTLGELKAQEQQNSVVQHTNREALGRVLISLHHLSRASPILMALTQRDPHEMVRSAIVLRSVVPYLQAITEKLRQELERLKVLRQSIVDEKMMLTQTSTSLDNKREHLNTLLQEKAALQEANATHQKKLENHIQRLARQADTMRDLLAELEAEGAVGVYRRLRRAHDPASVIPQSKIAPNRYGKFQMVPPVHGKIAARFGQKTERNDQGLGTVYETRHRAQVVSPAPGQVVFAGPFRSYKKIIIVDHSRGFHTLFAGMDQVSVTIGQEVVAGEPLGCMASNSSSAAPKLYMELRRNGEPINPEPWMLKKPY